MESLGCAGVGTLKPKGDEAKEGNGYLVCRHGKEMEKWWCGETSKVKKQRALASG